MITKILKSALHFLLLGTSLAIGNDGIKDLPLEPTPSKTEVISESHTSFFSYNYTSFDEYNSNDVDFTNGYKIKGGGLHRIGIGGRDADGSGGMLSYSFSDDILLSGRGNFYLGGFGDFDIKMKRYEIDIVGFQANKKYNDHFGLKFIRLEREYSYRRISGITQTQTFDISSNYLGFFFGWGANDPIFKDSPELTLFWSVQPMIMWGFMDKMAVGYSGVVYREEDWESSSKEYTHEFVLGGNGAVGIQFHLGENASTGVGYKSQYLEGGDMKDFYHGWMFSAIFRF